MMALISISPLFLNFKQYENANDANFVHFEKPLLTVVIARNEKKPCCDYSQLITLTRIQCTVNQLLVLKKEYYVKIEL